MGVFSWARPQLVLHSGSFTIAHELDGPFNPVLRPDGDGYRIWMNQSFLDWTVEIWHGRSSNGLTWRDLGKAFGPESIGADDVRVGSISLWWEGDHFRVWFYVFDGHNRRVWTALSADGLSIEDPRLAIDVGSCPPYDNQYTYNPFVLRDRRDGRYRMWRTGWEKWDVSKEAARGLVPGGFRVIHAWSDDGSAWYDHRMVVDQGAEGTHDLLGSRLPGNVIQLADGSFELWYAGCHRDEARDAATWCVMRAISDDGLVWRDHSPEIPAGFEGAWDSAYTYSPFAIREAGRVRLWYAGRSAEHGWSILYTEAPATAGGAA